MKKTFGFIVSLKLECCFQCNKLNQCKNRNLYAVACTAECSLEITRQLGNGENVCKKTDTSFKLSHHKVSQTVTEDNRSSMHKP